METKISAARNRTMGAGRDISSWSAHSILDLVVTGTELYKYIKKTTFMNFALCELTVPLPRGLLESACNRITYVQNTQSVQMRI